MNVLEEFMKSWKVTDLMEIHCFNNEETKFLPVGWCHHNVYQMTKKFGGNSVLGFSITDMDTQYWCIPHSIWKTDDGEFKDVTYKDKKSILFVPIKTYDPSLQYWFIPFEFRLNKDFNLGYESNVINSEHKNYSYSKLQIIDAAKLLCSRDYSVSMKDDWEDYLEEVSLLEIDE
jgi:hypothetical protein